MNRIEISVIIPVYNTGSILQETIDSVLDQNCRNFELIIVDDGSDDPETIGILDRQCDERIRIVRQKNAGVAAARNQGMALAEGKYVAFLDHDDLFLPEKLQESLQLFNTCKDAVLVYSGTIPIGSFADRVIHLEKAEGRVFPEVIAQNPILSMSCSVAEKDFLQRYDIKFDSACVPCDDWDFHLRCALHGNIYCTARPLVKYRYHDNNLSSNAIKMYYAGINVINKYQAMLPELVCCSGFSRRCLQKSINYIAFKHYYGLAFEYLKKRELKKSIQYMFRAFLYRPIKCLTKILRFGLKKIFQR